MGKYQQMVNKSMTLMTILTNTTILKHKKVLYSIKMCFIAAGNWEKPHISSSMTQYQDDPLNHLIGITRPPPDSMYLT